MREHNGSDVAANGPSSSLTSDAHYYEGQDLEALSILPAYQEWILERFRPHLRGKVIEIGAGLGNISARYADLVQELLLLEPAQNLESRLRQRFEDRPNVRVCSALIETLHADIAALPGAYGAPFDTALMVNVLEHVADDASMLGYVHGALRPRGALLLFVPACPWAYGTLDEKVGHLRRYTLGGLARLVQSAGFSIETIRYFDLLGLLPWFFEGRIRKAVSFSPRLATLYDRILVPFARAMERHVTPPVGKNLLCIARSNGSTR